MGDPFLFQTKVFINWLKPCFLFQNEIGKTSAFLVTVSLYLTNGFRKTIIKDECFVYANISHAYLPAALS